MSLNTPLTDCGKLFACGSNVFGQLGVGKSMTHSADLLVVEVSSQKHTIQLL